MRPSLLVLALCLAPTLAFAQPAPGPAAPPPPPIGCDSVESHQFDFWVGRWSVTPTQAPNKHVADSLIEKVYNGCGVRENWMPLSGGTGGSLSSYVPGDKGWRQTWIDSSGSWVEFKGGFDGHAMVITGLWPSPGHDHQLSRMSYTKGDDGSVRQFGQSSDDEGKTWQPAFDFTYHPVKP